jgi:hypothetical protein
MEAELLCDHGDFLVSFVVKKILTAKNTLFA